MFEVFWPRVCTSSLSRGNSHLLCIFPERLPGLTQIPPARLTSSQIFAHTHSLTAFVHNAHYCFQRPLLLECSGTCFLTVELCHLFSEENGGGNGNFFLHTQLPTDPPTTKWNKVKMCTDLLAWPAPTPASHMWWFWKLQMDKPQRRAPGTTLFLL